MVSPHPSLSPEARRFLRERHLATLSTLFPDGTLHVVPVGFTWDADRFEAWVLASGTSQKVANVLAGSRACLCQVDGRRWLSFEGPAFVERSAEVITEAERRHAQRYRVPRENPARVCLRLAAEHVRASG